MPSELAIFAARVREFIRHSDADQRGFNALALELFGLQFAHNAAYRKFCEARRVTSLTATHWSQIPAMPTAAFKEFELTSLALAERTHVFHSSGTTGQAPSRHFHCVESLAVYEASLLAWFRHQFPARGELLILTPPPGQVWHSSLVHMFEVVRREFGAAENSFVGNVAADGAWTLDLDRTLARLEQVSRTATPFLLLGTAFSFVHLLDELGARGLRFELPPGSRVLETGGYKGRSRALPKPELHGLITERLGVPRSHILCEYGMSELGSQAYDKVPGARCQVSGESSPITRQASRAFHFPPWARAQIISPETGLEISEGETGLIRVFDLANVFSVLAIQTEDLGIRRGEGFELLGRAEFAEPRGCSLMTVEKVLTTDDHG